MSEPTKTATASDVASALTHLTVEEIDAKVSALEAEIRSLKVVRTAVKAANGKRKRKSRKPAETPAA